MTFTAGSPDSLSLVLVKPDGLARAAVVRDLLALVGEAGLEVASIRSVGLNPERIAAIWPQFPPDTCPFTFALNGLYLGRKPSCLLEIRGRDAIAACRRIKKTLRKRYAEGLFANCLHCPSNAAELEIQYTVLVSGSWDRLETVTANGEIRPWGGAWGRLAACSTADIRSVASMIWTAARRRGWGGLWSPLPTRGAAFVSLHNDDHHSLDYAASCLADVISTWSPAQVGLAAIEADRAGSVMLLHAQVAEAESLAASLRKWGLDARARPVWASAEAG